MNKKRTGFVSTRIAGTDGVSLEIEKWAEVLERNECRCFYYAGELDRPDNLSYLQPEGHFKHHDIEKISSQVFGVTVRSGEISDLIHSYRVLLRESLRDFIETMKIDLVIAENALSVPMNIPLGLALTDIASETAMPVLAHHHDFFWERERYLVSSVEDHLSAAFPPRLPSVRHVVINSIAQEALAYRCGLESTVIPNVYDFAHPPGPVSDTVKKAVRDAAGLRDGELFFLQPTRVVPRKWIERSVDLVYAVSGRGGKLVVSHDSGDEGDEYCDRIHDYAAARGIDIVFINDRVSAGPEGGQHDMYRFTLGQVYQASDFVCYPSGCEGFGNAFLETIYYRKPLMVNRYPVYIKDIEPRGFKTVSIDGFVTSATAEVVEYILSNEEYREEITENNYKKAAGHFSFETLEEKLLPLIR